MGIQAMILAAGKGTRLLPLTETMPKTLVPICGVPMLEHTIRYLISAGVDEIIINVHHFADHVVRFVESNHSFGIRIVFSDESDELLDTGGGLYKAGDFFRKDQPFFLVTSDVITNLNLKDLYRFHQQHNPLVTLAVKPRKTTREFLFDDEYRLCGWQNLSTGEIKMARAVQQPIPMAFSAIHVIHPEIFALIEERGKFPLIDVYLRLALRHRLIGYPHPHSEWFEMGRLENIAALNTNPVVAGMIQGKR